MRVVFCDISKSFDRVWHEGLLLKLEAAGIKGSNELTWFRSYLSNRKQRVALPGSESQWNDIRAGGPQGSIIGPLLFLLFINDIVKDIGCNIRLFADDTCLFLVVENPDTAANLLNLDLDKIMAWAKKWLVLFNPVKTESFPNQNYSPSTIYGRHSNHRSRLTQTFRNFLSKRLFMAQTH